MNNIWIHCLNLTYFHLDTPWDEPTPASSEFDAFSKGELDEQWNSFPPEIKCLLFFSFSMKIF